MTFSAKIETFDQNSLGYGPYFVVPQYIVDQFEKPHRNIRVTCILNSNMTLSRAIAQKDDWHYILINKDVVKSLNVNFGDSVEVALKPDQSKYGVPISKEMQEVLFQDPEGADLFHQLTIGNQRGIILLISKYKSAQLRIERSFIVLEHLRNNLGKLDQRQLMQDFKKFKM